MISVLLAFVGEEDPIQLWVWRGNYRAIAGRKEGGLGMALGTKSREETFSDAAREERSVEPESIKRVGSPTVPPTQEVFSRCLLWIIWFCPFFRSLLLRPSSLRECVWWRSCHSSPVGEHSCLGLWVENVSTHGRSWSSPWAWQLSLMLGGISRGPVEGSD